MPFKRVLLLTVLLVMQVATISVIRAQETPADPPPSAQLDGMTQVWQQFNRCSAAAFTILISYYGWDGTYDEMIRNLNPHAEDVSVRVEEMVVYAQSQGLEGIVRTGGTIDLLRKLVAAGFPVLVENVYYDGPNGWQDWMSHNRVVMGYDDALQVFYTYDPLLGSGTDGQGRPVDFAELDERWKPFNRDYVVLYRPEEEERLQAVLGDQWDETRNAEWTLEMAEDELAGDKPDSFSMFNRGSAQLALGDYTAAAESFDQARQIGLPWRMLWYEFGPFEAYLQVGRYEDTLNLVRQVLSTTPGVEEVYYYAARAYEALGDIQRARANYEVAILRNANFTAAREGLAQLESTLESGSSS